MYTYRILLILFLCFESYAGIGQSYIGADLPDALTFLDGRKVKSKKDWEKRKQEIKKLWCDYYIGHFPQVVPPLSKAQVIDIKVQKDGSKRKRVILTFETPTRQSFEIEIWEPNVTHLGRRPLFLTQPRQYQIQWAAEAVKRGYIACLYPGLDAHHTEDEYPNYQNIWQTFKTEYPEAGWSSSLGIQAWLASRTLDYFLGNMSGYSIDTSAIAIAGHSRYGKQSIYAAAFDQRFKAVIARSSGTPTGCSYRFASRQTFMESVADFPSPWAKQSLTEFLGKENELPIEGNALLACIAPRNLMIHTAYNDGSDPTFGVERNYLNAKKVFQFLDAEENICLSYRKGQHNPITKAHTKHMFDYFDMAFQRNKLKPANFPEVLLHHFDWKKWKARQLTQNLILPNNATILEKIHWMLGDQPKEHNLNVHCELKDEVEWGVPKWSRDRWNPGGMKRVPFSFAGNMNGNIYFDPNAEKYHGTVIWLHPWNYSHGSNEGYGVQGTTIYWRLAQEGYIVLCYDQFGFGDQLTQLFRYYENNPHWSLLGRAVADVSRAIDFLIDGKGKSAEAIPETDPSQIYICGFSYGGMIGLYASAFDHRVAGVASFSGFTPMRTDTDNKTTGGIRRLWEWHQVLPKLGLYHGQESQIPYDYQDILALIAPRHCLIYAPLRDRFTDPQEVRSCVIQASHSWNNKKDLTLLQPDDICRFQRDQQDIFLMWLGEITKKRNK